MRRASSIKGKLLASATAALSAAFAAESLPGVAGITFAVIAAPVALWHSTSRTDRSLLLHGLPPLINPSLASSEDPAA